MKRTLLFSSLLLALAGCQQDTAESERQAAAAETTPVALEAPAVEPVNAPEALGSGLLLENMDTKVRPGDDFNAFVNGAWMATAEISADRPNTSAGMDVHEAATDDVRVIIEASAEGDYPPGSDEQKVGDLYTSYMDMDTRNAKGVGPLAADFAAIDALVDKTGMAIWMAEANKEGVALPWTLGQYTDFKDPNTYMMYTWQSGLGLPDREYYFDDSEKGRDLRAAYQVHVERMFELAGLPDPAGSAQLIVALETRMAAEQMLKEKTRDVVAIYNKIPLDEVPALMPNFAWPEYIETSGVGGIDGLVITQLDYMKALDGILAETDLDTWKTYLKWRVLDARANLLSETIDAQNFAFNGKALWGTEQQLPQWKRAVSVVNGNLGEVVGKVYVERHFPPEAKARMMEMVNNLTLAYEQSIRELDWMGEETRAEALDKLSKFTPKIGYPDEWRDYSELEIAADDLVGNMKRSARFTYDRNLARQGGAVDRGEWQMTPQTVNAYYNPPLNEIVFPAAILQPPFFDLSADEAVNYGAIGAVIGHEIGHGFDDSGSTFDGDGVLRNWWTERDKAEFEKRTSALVEQYNQFRPFEDLAVNGEFTLGENIGDLGGLAIAVQAYELSLDGEEAPVLDGYTGLQRVFLGYGQAWRGKVREEALRLQIATDPHSPREYRVNGVVRNVPEFYEAFDIAETDALYLPPEQRVKIW